jgi:iron complex outermembrane recepter protein
MTLRVTLAYGSMATLLSIVGSGAITLSAQAQDQQPAATSERLIEQVIVTARRREESMQEVPIAVTALSAEDLRDANVVRVEELGRVTASLVVTTTANRNTVPSFGIRGQRNDAAFITNDPSVGVYVAEAVQARMFGLAQSLFDLESVQVLKGPQGTLFGRNTTGGAVLFQPARPTLGVFEGYVQARAGDLGRRDAQGAVSLPIGENTAVRVAINRTYRDGFVQNVFLGEDLNEENTLAARAVLLAKPTDWLTNTLYLDYFDADQSGNAARITAVNPSSPAQRRYGMLDVLARWDAELDFHEVEGQMPGKSAGSNFGITNLAELDLTDSLKLKTILNYRDLEMVENQDLDGSFFTILELRESQQAEQYSAELQLQGASFGDRLDWIMGAYYYREDAQRQTFTIALGATPNPRFGDAVSESQSVFAQGDLGIGESLTLTLGARYTWDTREFEQRLLSPTSGQCLFCAEREADFTALTYTVSLGWQIDAQRLLYVATRRGFRAGGFDSSGNNALALEPFDPEKVTDYEIGFKGDFTFRHGDLRTNLAVYRSDYEDIQRTVLGQVNGVPVTSIFNAASATVDGAEVELTFAPSAAVELIASTAWIDTQYDSFITQTAIGPVDQSGNTFGYVPEWTYRGGARLRLPFAARPGSETWVRADYFWQDDVYHSEFNAPWNFQKSYGLLSARLDLKDVFIDGLDLGVWGTNLTDEEYFTSAGDQYTGGLGFVYRALSEPRAWGVDVRFTF